MKQSFPISDHGHTVETTEKVPMWNLNTRNSCLWLQKQSIQNAMTELKLSFNQSQNSLPSAT